MATWGARQADRSVASRSRRGRGLIRQNLAAGYGRLTPIDSIHLATAKAEGADEIATYEINKQAQWATLIGLSVVEPSLTQLALDFGSSASG